MDWISRRVRVNCQDLASNFTELHDDFQTLLMSYRDLSDRAETTEEKGMVHTYLAEFVKDVEGFLAEYKGIIEDVEQR